MTLKDRLFYGALLVTSAIGFLTNYLPGVWNQPIGFWFSDLIETLSYFTILSNLAVLVLAVSQLFFSQKDWALTLSSMTAQTSIAVYITITALIYHVLLADTWNPQGVDYFSDVLLHTITPVLYALFWFVCVRGKIMSFQRTVHVLLFPLVLMIYWLFRGAVAGSYPYYFIDASQLGYVHVMFNSIGMAILFWCISAFYWAISKYTTPLYV